MDCLIFVVQNAQFHKFIIITMILQSAHYYAICTVAVQEYAEGLTEGQLQLGGNTAIAFTLRIAPQAGSV